MNDPLRRSSGFTLIELMIVIAIIGILAATAVPQYSRYTKMTKVSELVITTSSYKSAVHLCVQDLNTLTGCDDGENGIPPSIDSPVGYVESLTTANGTIAAVGTSAVDGVIYTLSPTYDASGNSLTWTAGGSCVTSGLCRD